MRVYDFKDTINVGAQGESIIYDYLQNLDSFHEIKDVRDYPEFRDMDIDFVAQTTTSDIVSLEIKTDTYDTGNLFYEYTSCIETQSIGCMQKTQATYILYYFTKTKELYILQTDEFRQWVNDNIHTFRARQVKNWRYNGSQYTSLGYLIPKIYIENNFEYYLKIKIK